MIIQTIINKQASFTTIIRALVIFTVCLSLVYGFLLIKTISLANDRKSMKTDMRNYQVTISELETNYFNLARSIDTVKVSELGFQEISDPVFAYTEPLPTTEHNVALK